MFNLAMNHAQLFTVLALQDELRRSGVASPRGSQEAGGAQRRVANW